MSAYTTVSMHACKTVSLPSTVSTVSTSYYPYLDPRSNAKLQSMVPAWVSTLVRFFRKIQTALEVPVLRRRPDHTVYKLDCGVLGISFKKTQVSLALECF